MQSLPENSGPTWVDGFVSRTPPTYIADYDHGPRHTEVLEEWSGDRRAKALRSLKEFLEMVSPRSSLEDVIAELERSPIPDTTALAVKLVRSTDDEDGFEVEGAADKARAIVDPIARATLFARVLDTRRLRDANVRHHALNLQRKYDRLRSVLILVIVPIATFLFFFFVSGFHQHRYELSVGSPNPEAVRGTWWGLRSRRLSVRWMEFEGFEAWCAQDKKGEWYPYLTDDDRLD